MQVNELNFILHSEIFVHYNGWLRASHKILGCTPSYTSYEDSSGTLSFGSPLLSYVDVRLLSFLLPRLTSGEARELSPRLVRHDSLEPIQDGLWNIVFQGRLEHIPVDAPPWKNLEEEDPTAEENILAAEMVKKRSMTLDHWF